MVVQKILKCPICQKEVEIEYSISILASSLNKEITFSYSCGTIISYIIRKGVPIYKEYCIVFK